MSIESINPQELEIDEINERTDNVGPHTDEDLEESVEQQGVIQPPIVRKNGDGYKVVVGQRRTLAAKAVGLDEVPVRIVDWDDGEALEATITENIDAFRREITPSDRAASITRLMKEKGWEVTDAADNLGVSTDTIRRWTERANDEWEGTPVHVDEASDESEAEKAEIEEVADQTLSQIRTATETKEERSEAVKKAATSAASRDDVRKAKKRSENRGEPITETIDEVTSEKKERQKSEIKARVDVTLTGGKAEGLRRAAKDIGTSEDRILEEAIEYYLSDEGYI